MLSPVLYCHSSGKLRSNFRAEPATALLIAGVLRLLKSCPWECWEHVHTQLIKNAEQDIFLLWMHVLLKWWGAATLTLFPACERLWQNLLTDHVSATSRMPSASQQESTDTQKDAKRSGTPDASAFWWASPALIAVMLWELISLEQHRSHSSRWLPLNSRFPFIHQTFIWGSRNWIMFNDKVKQCSRLTQFPLTPCTSHSLLLKITV